MCPDSIVPEPGNPQALNRYAYAMNNPLGYVDPSGHDTMIVPGVGGEADYDDPMIWREWIMAAQGWDNMQWSEFYNEWTTALAYKPVSGGTSRVEVAEKYGVKIFKWRNVEGGSLFGDVGQAADALAYQMREMRDVKLIAHSKGGAVAEKYLGQMKAGALSDSPVSDMVLIDGAINTFFDFLGLFDIAGLDYTVTSVSGLSSGPRVTTINNWLDPIGGQIQDAKNLQVNMVEPWGIVNSNQWLSLSNLFIQGFHGLKSDLANRVFPATPR